MIELRAVLERFREWHANHFGDFTPEVNAELLCLENDAAEALARATRALTDEQEHSMMAGSQNSAMRLQLKDAEERASRWAKIADQRAIEVADLKRELTKQRGSVE